MRRQLQKASNVTDDRSASPEMTREADLSNAESSDRYRDVGQIVDVMNSHLGHSRQYLDYLFQYDVDPSALQQIVASFKQIDSQLVEVQSSVKHQEADRLVQARVFEHQKTMPDSERYKSALSVYESGNVKKARAMFSALARYGTDKTVRNYSRQAFDTIIQWENDQNRNEQVR
jgi:RNA polymerase-interacting CarD/CdnL/TRCF family regulator